MLQAIRDKTKGIFVGAVIVLLSIPFIFVGVQGYDSMTAENIVAQVNGARISQSDFQTKYSRYLNQMRARFGANFNLSTFDQPVVRRQFLDSLIQEELMYQVAADHGLDVSSERLQRAIFAVDAFKVDGQFNADRYVNLLQSQGMSVAQFERDVRRELLVGLLPSALNETAVALPSEVATFERLQKQTRSFDFITFSASEFTDTVSVSEQEIESYYASHGAAFTNPETVTIEYVELDASQFDQEVVVDEEMLRERYEQQRDRFMVPERRLASHILLNLDDDADEETVAAIKSRAEEIVSRARAGEDFAALAREYSEDLGSANDGGDLGWVERGMMVSSFEEALFGLDAGQISEPVQSVYGFHVIALREVEATHGKPFAEVREALAAEEREIEAERLFLEQQERLRDLSLEDQGSLEPVVDVLGLELQQAGPFSRAGGEGIAANQEVIETAFSPLVLDEGLNSQVVSVGQNHIVVLRVVGHQAETPQPLEEVKDQIRQTLAASAAREAAEAQAQAALAEARSAGTLSGDEQRELAQAQAVGRSGSSYDNAIVDAVFKLPRPQAGTIFEMIPYGSDQFAVVALRQVSDPDLGEDAEDARLDNVSARIARTFSAAEEQALLAALRQQADIEVNEAGLEPSY